MKRVWEVARPRRFAASMRPTRWPIPAPRPSPCPGGWSRNSAYNPLRSRQARTSAGPVTLQVYGTVRLTVQGRDCTCDVVEIPDDCPVLIGQVPLELLDFVVDPSGQRLIGNPAHGGEHVIELY